MLFTFVSIVVFFGILCFFGWQITRFFLKENRAEVLLPFSFVIGASFYIFLLNITSYLIPIIINFYLILFLIFLFGLVLKIINKKELLKIQWGLSRKEIWVVVLTALVIMFFSGLIALRSIESDDLAWLHLPTASSIAGGNFPVKDLIFPDRLYAYHYGYSLFFGSISKITGLSVWFVSDLVTFLFSGVIFLLLFLISRLIIKDNLKSYVVALVGMFGGSLSFVYFFSGIITLYKKFILHYDIIHPFVFLAKVWGGGGAIIPPVIQQLGIIWAPLGLSIALAIIYLYLDFIKYNERRNKLFFIILMVILFAILSLIFEYAPIVIGITIIIHSFVLYFFYEDKKQIKFLLPYSLIFLTLATLVSLVQGGTVTVLIMNLISDSSVFGQPLSVNFFKQIFYFRGVFIFGKNAVIDTWGIVYFLIIPASYYIIKKHFKNGLFLVLVSFVAFCIPLIVAFNEMWEATMSKFFYLTQIGWMMVVGIFLMEIKDSVILKKNPFFNRIIFLVLVAICFSGVFYLVTNYFYPYRPENKGFVSRLSKPSSLHVFAYSWIKHNTESQDYFFVFGDPSEMKIGIRQNYKFVLFTDRISPTYQYLNDLPDSIDDVAGLQTFVYRSLVKNCDQDSLKELNFRYLFVDSNWPDGLEKKCLEKNNLDLKFNMKSDDDFVRIYQVK